MAEASSVGAAGSQNKSIPQDKLLHFVRDNRVPSEMQWWRDTSANYPNICRLR